MMERGPILQAMAELKLYGMKAAYDELVTHAVKRQYLPQQVIGELLQAEIHEKQARSVRYQMTIARMPRAQDVEDFQFADTPVNETLVRDLARGEFLDLKRNVVLVVSFRRLLQLPINFFFCNLIGESTCNDICQARHSSPDNSCSGRSIGSAIKVTTQSGDCPDVKIQVW